MAQLWKSQSLIHYKDLKYNMVDYALISALTYYCVLGKKTPALYPNRISGLILVRRNTHRWSDRKKIRKICNMNTFVLRNIRYDSSITEIMA